jgi:hypothetical protein
MRLYEPLVGNKSFGTPNIGELISERELKGVPGATLAELLPE